MRIGMNVEERGLAGVQLQSVEPWEVRMNKSS